MGLTAEIKSLLTGVSNVYEGSIPDDPDTVIGIYPTGGAPRSLSGTMLEEPSFQIKVRTKSFPVGVALCDSIKNKLHGQTSTKVLMIQQMGDVQGLGRDSQNRPMWSINFRCYYRG